MQVVGAAGERLALEPLDPLVGHAVAVCVGQLPDGGRRSDVERAAVPHRPFGEHHLVGEDGPSCRIFRRRCCLPAGRSGAAFRPVASSRCRWSPKSRRHTSRPSSSKAAVIGRSTSGGPGDPLDREPLGDRERAAVELDLARLARADVSSHENQGGGNAQESPRMDDRFMRKSPGGVPIRGPTRSAQEWSGLIQGIGISKRVAPGLHVA